MMRIMFPATRVHFNMLAEGDNLEANQPRLERNPQTHHLDDMAHGVNVNYTAVLGTKGDFKPALWVLAVQHDLPRRHTSRGLVSRR